MRYWGKVIGLVLGLLSGAGFLGNCNRPDHWAWI